MTVLLEIGQNLTTVSDLCASALWEINAVPAGDTPPPDELITAAGKLNRLLDRLNATPDAAYADVFSTFPLSPGVNPHTIGAVGATFTATLRPDSIDAAMLITGSTRIPINIIDRKDDYFALPVPTLQSTYPTDLWYSADWPNGSIYFYPVPSSALSVVLMTRQLLSRVALSSIISLPFGYQDMLTLTLAESLCSHYEKTASADLKREAKAARALIFGKNRKAPAISTAGYGCDEDNGENYLTGWWRR